MLIVAGNLLTASLLLNTKLKAWLVTIGASAATAINMSFVVIITA